MWGGEVLGGEGQAGAEGTSGEPRGVPVVWLISGVGGLAGMVLGSEVLQWRLSSGRLQPPQARAVLSLLSDFVP